MSEYLTLDLRSYQLNGSHRKRLDDAFVEQATNACIEKQVKIKIFICELYVETPVLS